VIEHKVGTREGFLGSGEEPKCGLHSPRRCRSVLWYATLRKFVDNYGIGPWDIYEFNPSNAKDLCEYGKPVERSWRLAITMIGGVQWELIEPLDNESIYAQFLAQKGEGVHHIAVLAPKFEEMLAAQAKQGKDLVLSGEFSGIKVAYLDTERDLGVVVEIFSGMPDVKQKPDAT